MALTKSLSRLDHPTLQTHGEGMEREALLALSQRKLNALAQPLCYIDAEQLLSVARELGNSGYGAYLERVVADPW